MSDKKENQLVLAIKETGLQKEKVEVLLENFAGFFKEAKELAKASRGIVVTDETQTDLMIQARKSRLKLKNVRVEVEKTRYQLKEQSLREGKAIDGISNLIKALIVPVEEHLQKQEDFVEIKETKRLDDRNADRTSKLSVYVEDVSVYILRDMSDVAFEKLLKSSKATYDARIATEKKAEEEKLAAEKKVKEERVQIEKENKRLKKEAEEREKEAKEHEKEAEKERKVNQIKMDKERKKTGVAESKLKAEKEAQKKKEREAREVKEAEKKAKEEADRKALLAPDKEKLIEFAGAIDKLQAPNVASREAGLIVNEAIDKLSKISSEIREKSKTL